MQFTTPFAFLALAFSVAANPTPSDMGAWNATVETKGSEHELFAMFVSDSYPMGIRCQCNGTICRPQTFSWEYNGALLNLSLNVEKPDRMTVFGSAPLVLDPVTKSGNVIVHVTSATA
ncbi:hypothetical protein P3342_003009 [Pyrenophora teres f. teres]|uniref:Uncharacterized protein n=2 Tax=Pyrenophora teres f. teres TaxID=97479 RepID=E3S5A1_PYRTT|nr:hypothetical protein PTT_17799 [Pyrenophora teres f. teres 0-1]KAE8842273.1 hypothetical protein HRS9139_01570 [Pyrenophora teres f. teres]KAE8850655.1 hypothetical protein PTNB85_01071 [Pyrenophora teres f. teres]KAE8851311.1 hypothetical protein HRS9122_01598 [Pyrenophora teres f. teres]KAE8869983.1 hypothetical protein PTNB29_00327 [Pyrenophora teres f. teres]